jgi:hypothetical protein
LKEPLSPCARAAFSFLPPASKFVILSASDKDAGRTST